MCEQLQRWNFIGLLLLLLALNILGTADCSICETCICSSTDSARMVNCRGKRLDGGSVLNFDVLLFDQESHMTDLDLSENEMPVLPTDIFRDLRDMKMLNMSDNKLQDIPPEAFDHLESLTGLDLSQNVLSSLQAALFSKIKSLEYLNVRNNQLKELDPAIQYLTNLTWLDVSRNYIESLENGSFATLTELKHLDLSFNRIAYLGTNNLVHLTRLVTLNIDNNRLVHLSPHELPVSVTNLNAGYNKISAIPETLINLRILNVEYNKISELDGNSTVFAKLESFNISGNELTDFPDVVLESLETLDLSFNRLTAVPESLNAENLPVLSTLVISGNPIRELKFNSELNLELLVAQSLDLLENIEEGAFDKLGTLESDGCLNLTISKNKRLEKIHVKAFEDVNVCALDLSSNNLTSVYPSLTKSSNVLGANYSVNLQDNPFHCDCSLQWILVDLIPRLYQVYPELLEDLRCASPLDIKDMRMVHWYKWKEQVFCKDSQVLVPKSVQAAEVMSGGGGTIKIESSTEMLAVLIGAAVGLSMLVIIGLVLARRIAVQRSRRNRRF